nr:MAG: polyprotein P2ab [Sobemovirus sp.]
MHYPEMSGLLLIIMLLANLCILYDHLVLDVEYPRFLLLLALTTLCAIPLWLIGWCVMYLVKYLMVRVTSETVVEKTHYVAVAPPYFDPVLGVAIRCAPAKGGDTIELQLEPAWANLFPSFPNLNQGKATEETGIVGSLYCPVKAGGEPSSVVMLKSNGVSIGMGCRLKTAEGEFLSTAMHVWQNPSKVTHMAKNGKEVEVKDWEPTLGCESPELDFALIPVPSQVWAKLGVKAATLAPPSTNQVVTAYGGPSSTGLYSGVGTLKTNEFSWKLTHTAPTAKAWSGTPLYSSRGVVGMHTGYEQVCVENRAVNLYYIVNCLCRKQETELPDLHVQEISLEDVETRSYEFLEVDIIGRGKAKIGKREFAWIPRSGKYWADEEEDSLPPVPKLEDGKVRWFDSNETFHPNEHLNLPTGGRVKTLAALFELAGYQLEAGGETTSRGMPFGFVGKSLCKFREVGRKDVSDSVRIASTTFPELADLTWPERGSGAELGSLLLQAGKFSPTRVPKDLEGACQRLLERYPASNPCAALRGESWSFDAVFQEVCKKAQSQEINEKASPGVPLSRLATNNGDLLRRHLEFVALCVTERLFLLASTPNLHALTPLQMVERGLCDPVRLFVKQEPHPSRKTKEGRFRLISSVSIVDQLVERMLFGPQNQLEISEWKHIPSKPGMGLSLTEQSNALFGDLRVKHSRCPAAEADISGFDWSVQDWELWADVEMRIVLGGFNQTLARAARNRFSCFMNSVLQLSDGTLLQQLLPGIMKSGSYCTSSTNSRIRCLMAELIGSPWCIAMGDDSVEGYVEEAQQRYAALGHVCKDYKPCLTKTDGSLYEVEFCSHVLRDSRCWLKSWPKTLFKYLCSDSPSFEDLVRELEGSPKWGQIKDYIVRNTPSPDKTNKTSPTYGEEAYSKSAGQGYREYADSGCPDEGETESAPSAACCAAFTAYPGWNIHGPYCSGDHGPDSWT